LTLFEIRLTGSLLRMSGICARVGEEGSDAVLVVDERLAPGLEHCLLKRRDAGQPGQDQIHDDGGDQADPAQGPGPRQVDGDDWIRDPTQPFEDIVGMTRQAPQAPIHDLAVVGGIGLEGLHLAVGPALAEDGDQQDGGADKVFRRQPGAGPERGGGDGGAQ
jgi:hypothetical protein